MKILFLILTFSNAISNVDESEILDELVLASEFKDLAKN